LVSSNSYKKGYTVIKTFVSSTKIDLFQSCMLMKQRKHFFYSNKSSDQDSRSKSPSGKKRSKSMESDTEIDEVRSDVFIVVIHLKVTIKFSVMSISSLPQSECIKMSSSKIMWL
jgi:hypothetical protein